MRPSLICLALLLACPPLFSADHPNKLSFPDDSQINLLVTQSERAFETYENAIKQEKLGLGDQGPESAARDREILTRARQYLSKLKSNPQGFNSPVGFLLVIDLDDASRNMAVCMGQSALVSSTHAISGNVSAAQSDLLLYQTCMGASQLLENVSETAVTMYEQYLLANLSLQQKQEKALGKGADILNKQQKPPK